MTWEADVRRVVLNDLILHIVVELIEVNTRKTMNEDDFRTLTRKHYEY